MKYIYITIYYVLYRGGGRKCYLVRTDTHTDRHTHRQTHRSTYRGGAHLKMATENTHTENRKETHSSLYRVAPAINNDDRTQSDHHLDKSLVS